MEDLNNIFANNLVELRKLNNLTQLELADKLGYSDKNISKWENGLAIPSADILLEMSRYFNVSVDYLLTEHTEDEKKEVNKSHLKSIRNKVLITGLAILCVWLVALLVFMSIFSSVSNAWIALLYGFPASAIVAIVFIPLWFKIRPYLFISISMLVWTLLASVYLTVTFILGFDNYYWLMFLLGIPLQLAIILWSQFKVHK